MPPPTLNYEEPHFLTRPYEEPMNASFVPYDFPVKILNVRLAGATSCAGAQWSL